VSEAPQPPPAGATPGGAKLRVRGRKRRALGRWTRRFLELGAAAIAATVVSFFSVDLGRVPGLDLAERAERAATAFLQRPMHIGRLSARITPGLFSLENVVIEGREPGDRPFLSAGRIDVQIDWSALWRNEVVLEVTMSDWDMVIERWANDRHNIPRLRVGGGTPSAGPPRFRPRVNFVYALRGSFSYEDHGAPWSIEAPDINVNVVRNRALSEYDGTARFDGGTVRILDFLPMWTNFATRFTIDGSKVRLHEIDLETDGARSALTGVVDFGNWPEQRYEIQSVVDFPRMREIFFTANSDWAFGGQGRFTGFFHLFKEGRELSGDFTSSLAMVNGFEFPNLTGSLTWLDDSFVVHRAESDFNGGRMNLTYGLAPLGTPGGATATFTSNYEGVDLASFGRRFDWGGLDPRGRLAGRVAMTWHNGRFSETLTGEGQTSITPDGGARLATAAMPPEPYARPLRSGIPFDGVAPLGAFVIGGDLRYQFGPEGLTFRDSWAATPTTYLAFSGTSGEEAADYAFRATSYDWQASDRLLAAVLTSRGSRTSAFEVGGRGTFDGRLTGSFSAPRVTGAFASEGLTAWDVEWGEATGTLAVEGGFVRITNGRVRGRAGGTIATDGLFSLGFRDDGRDEMDSTFHVAGWPLADVRHAFGLDDWPIDGTIDDARLALRGPYRRPFGDGRLRIAPGAAWEESFASAEGDLQFEGDGLQIGSVVMNKAGGVVRGAAHIGWDNTYDFDADGDRIPVESLDNFRSERVPVTGVMRFTATGGGSFDDPTYQVSPVIPDLYVGDEFVGQVSGRLTVRGELMTVDNFLATSARGIVNGSGRVALDDDAQAVLDLNFFEALLDPYLRFFWPDLAGYAVATASGRIHVEGPLSTPEAILVTATVDTAQLAILDFDLRNEVDDAGRPVPVRLSFRNNRFTIDHLRLTGEHTSLALTGGVNLTDSTVDVGLAGGASLTILQLFFPEVRASGSASLRATIVGSLEDYRLAGRADIASGRLRHSAFSHSLTDISGPIVFDRSGVNLDGLTARLGDGRVQFGGAILLSGTTITEFMVRAHGTAMNLRYPEGLRSTVNADLALTGPREAPLLSGSVDVLRASYRAPLDPNASLLGYAAAASGQLGGEVQPPQPPAAETGFPLVFDVRIVAARLPDPVIQLPDATIWASADLHFSGTVDRPQLSGVITLDQGELSFAGNRYTVQRGSVEFLSGPAGFEPFFDVEVEARIRVPRQTYRVNLRVTGTQSAFVPTLTSDPPLSSDIDILGLIFGELPDLGRVEQRALQSPQQAQAMLLRSAAAQILTSPITSGVERVVQQAVPIDTLVITPVLGDDTVPGFNPTARMTIGTRLTSRVFVTYSRTLNAAQYEVILIEYDQNDRLSWVLSRNEDRTFALDFRLRYVF